MQELTKAQAEWLIENILEQTKIRWRDEKSGLEEVFLFPIDVERIINQCTEQPFPGFTIHDVRGSNFITCKLCDNNDIELYISGYETDTPALVFNNTIFKHFTERCNTIVQWLEGQE